MTYDQWMDFCGIVGVCLFLLGQWWLMRGVDGYLLFLNKIMRLTGFCLLLVPLFSHWFLSAPALVGLSLVMICFSSAMFYQTRRGR